MPQITKKIGDEITQKTKQYIYENELDIRKVINTATKKLPKEWTDLMIAYQVYKRTGRDKKIFINRLRYFRKENPHLALIILNNAEGYLIKENTSNKTNKWLSDNGFRILEHKRSLELDCYYININITAIKQTKSSKLTTHHGKRKSHLSKFLNVVNKNGHLRIFSIKYGSTKSLCFDILLLHSYILYHGNSSLIVNPGWEYVQENKMMEHFPTITKYLDKEELQRIEIWLEAFKKWNHYKQSKDFLQQDAVLERYLYPAKLDYYDSTVLVRWLYQVPKQLITNSLKWLWDHITYRIMGIIVKNLICMLAVWAISGQVSLKFDKVAFMMKIFLGGMITEIVYYIWIFISGHKNYDGIELLNEGVLRWMTDMFGPLGKLVEAVLTIILRLPKIILKGVGVISPQTAAFVQSAIWILFVINAFGPAGGWIIYLGALSSLLSSDVSAILDGISFSGVLGAWKVVYEDFSTQYHQDTGTLSGLLLDSQIPFWLCRLLGHMVGEVPLAGGVLQTFFNPVCNTIANYASYVLTFMSIGSIIWGMWADYIWFRNIYNSQNSKSITYLNKTGGKPGPCAKALIGTWCPPIRDKPNLMDKSRYKPNLTDKSRYKPNLIDKSRYTLQDDGFLSYEHDIMLTGDAAAMYVYDPDKFTQELSQYMKDNPHDLTTVSNTLELLQPSTIMKLYNMFNPTPNKWINTYEEFNTKFKEFEKLGGGRENAERIFAHN
jgi:hypothetical protein